jgi:hypothetical protein
LRPTTANGSQLIGFHRKSFAAAERSVNELLDDKCIEPHVPVWDRTLRDDGTLSSSDFQWS